MVSNMPLNSTLLLQVASTHTLWDNNVVSAANFTWLLFQIKCNVYEIDCRMKTASQEGYWKEQPVLKILQLFKASTDCSAEVIGLHKVNWYNCRVTDFYFYRVCALKKSFPNLMHFDQVYLQPDGWCSFVKLPHTQRISLPRFMVTLITKTNRKHHSLEDFLTNASPRTSEAVIKIG